MIENRNLPGQPGLEGDQQQQHQQQQQQHQQHQHQQQQVGFYEDCLYSVFYKNTFLH